MSTPNYCKTIQKSLLLPIIIGGHKPLISEANFFTSGLEVPTTFKNVSGLFIEAKFFSQSVRIRILATVVSIKHRLKIYHN